MGGNLLAAPPPAPQLMPPQPPPPAQMTYEKPYAAGGAPPPPGPSPFDAPAPNWVITSADKQRYDEVPLSPHITPRKHDDEVTSHDTSAATTRYPHITYQQRDDESGAPPRLEHGGT